MQENVSIPQPVDTVIYMQSTLMNMELKKPNTVEPMFVERFVSNHAILHETDPTQDILYSKLKA